MVCLCFFEGLWFVYRCFGGVFMICLWSIYGLGGLAFMSCSRFICCLRWTVFMIMFAIC